MRGASGQTPAAFGAESRACFEQVLVWLEGSESATLSHGELEDELSGPAGLTDREVEVLGLLSQGFTSTEIAQRLFISAKTMRNHLEHVYQKAGVTNRTGAMLFALERGIVGTAGTVENEAAAP